MDLTSADSEGRNLVGGTQLDHDDDFRILIAVDSLANKAAASVHELGSFLKGVSPSTSNEPSLRRNLARLFDRGFLCQSKTADHFSLTPNGRWQLETVRLRGGDPR